jgi:23S rRNA pseudouridine2605 synthase
MTFKDKPKRTGGKPLDRDRKPRPAAKSDAAQTEKPHAAAKPMVVASDAKPERISKIMARAGVASRRDIERMIMEGRVSLNGVLLDSPVVNATLADVIEVDGMPIRGIERTRLWLYHKPAGLVTTNSDPEGRATVFDNLPGELPRVLSIGRLDINTEGLLLLTNDGGLSRVLELPTTGWLRRYRVRAHGDVDQAALDKLKDGIAVAGVLYGSIEATLDRQQGHNVWITMGLREGKNREIKNVLGALGLEVNRLIRISYGPFQLGDLPESQVVEVRGRMLRDQLGPRLIEEAGANFDAPLYNATVSGDDEDEAPAARPARPEWGQRGDRTEQRSGGFGDKREDKRERALGRLDTKPAGRPAGKSGGKFGGRDEGGEDRPKKRPPMGTNRTANVWMAPGARPTRDGKGAKTSARSEAERVFVKQPTPQEEALRVVVKRAEEDKDWIRADAPDKAPGGERGGRGGRGFGDRPRGEKSFGDRAPRGEKSFGDRPPRGDKPFGDRAPRGEKSFGDRPPRGDRPSGDRPYGDRPPRGDRPFGDRKPREEGDRPRGDRPFAAKPYGDKPRGERSFGDRPRGDRPQGERSFGDRPARSERPFADRKPREEGDRPRSDRPRGDRPFGAKPFGDKPRGDRPQGARPSGGRPQGDRPQGDRPYSARPQGDRPQSDRPYTGRPQGDRPQGDRPQGDRPQGDRPRGGKPFAGKPRSDRADGGGRGGKGPNDRGPNDKGPGGKGPGGKPTGGRGMTRNADRRR